jgi:hypothetical protein
MVVGAVLGLGVGVDEGGGQAWDGVQEGVLGAARDVVDVPQRARFLRERSRTARPMLAGRPHEAAGNGSPRWMAAGPRERVHRTRPTGRLVRRLPSANAGEPQGRGFCAVAEELLAGAMEPRCTGKKSRRYSSTRSCSISSAQALRCHVPAARFPGHVLSLATSAVTSPQSPPNPGLRREVPAEWVAAVRRGAGAVALRGRRPWGRAPMM